MGLKVWDRKSEKEEESGRKKNGKENESSRLCWAPDKISFS